MTIHNGAALELREILAGRGFDRVSLVTGGRSFSESGAADRILPQIEGRIASRYGLAKANPSEGDVEEAVAQIVKDAPQAILAVGGGSVIDLAKIVTVCLASNESVRSVLIGSASDDSLSVPVIAIPTTSGSGAEMTAFATVYVDQVKFSVAHPKMRPIDALVDPELTYSMSPALTASTGLDVLSHAIESLWSVRSTDESVEAATRALDLAWGHLGSAVHQPDPENRLKMAEASNLAGQAIAISRTTACHALSYRLTSHFGVPHGHAAALTLGAVLQFNSEVGDSDVVDPRGVDHVRAAIDSIISRLGADSPAAAAAVLTEFIGQLNLATRLSELGVVGSGVLALARSANLERLGNNPRAFDESRALDVLAMVE